MQTSAVSRPLIVHVVYSFAVGGLENGVVNLINRLPPDRWRHAVVSLTDVSAEFCRRVERDDVRFQALRKRDGHLMMLYPKLTRLFRTMKPAIVHTRNMAALEATIPAWLANVPVRIHGEHGWDTADLDGTSARMRWVRRAFRPFVSNYVALSRHLADYLQDRVGVDRNRVAQLYNGVDTARFQPAPEGRTVIADCPFHRAESFIVGTVGRMQTVKDQVTLATAFVRAIGRDRSARARLRLVMVGDGPLRAETERILDQGGVRNLSWVPGERTDIAGVLRGLDLFVLPSLAEGISNTILEAMATGLPVVATKVGGNGELVEQGLTGELVPAANPDALADAILRYFRDPGVVRRHGKAGRNRVERQFSLDQMIAGYDRLYCRLLERSGVPYPSLIQA
jgi:sugar transferase (PEP-CTERM/EpsH1 system associated)